MLYYKSDQERELSLYPKEYTFLMAIENGNLITYGAASYNINRMDRFMYNYIHKIPDRIVIVKYGIDKYPSIGILQYTGELMIYTVRYYDQREVECYITDYGAILFKLHIRVRDMLQCVYNLKTLENRDVTVFRVLLGRVKE